MPLEDRGLSRKAESLKMNKTGNTSMLRWLICKLTEGTSYTTCQCSRLLQHENPEHKATQPGPVAPQHDHVPGGEPYLHDVFFFHPRWKRETLAEDLEQHGPQSIVVISLHWPDTFNMVPPEQFLISLSVCKDGLNELPCIRGR